MHRFTAVFRSLYLCILLGSVGTLLLPVSLFGQTVTGSIYGTITDDGGAVVPGATIVAVNIATNRSTNTTSNNSGAYVFPVIDPGTYKVSASQTGFETTIQKDLIVAANQNVNASFAMKVGSVTSEITISSTSSLIDTRESQLAYTIPQQVIQDLPLVGRSPYDLVQLTPGVTGYNGGGSQSGDNTGTQFSTNGIRNNFNSYYLDGAFDTELFHGGGNVIPNPDALSQFRMITDNFDSEFGRYPGAVVNVITRSGTNQFHGTAYDFVRNNIFNAKPYFQTSVPHYVYNAFGGGVGGPILHDKLFIYGSYQGIRYNTPTTINAGSFTVLTDAERMGDFSNSSVKPNLPAGTNCGSAAAPRICPAALDIVTNNILAFVPHAQSATSPTNAQQQVSNPLRSDQGTLRVDYHLNAAHSISLTVFHAQGSNFSYTAGGNQLLTYSGDQTKAGQTNYVLSDTWILSPRVVNTLTGFYTVNKTVRGNIYETPTLSSLGSQIPEGGPLTTQPQIIVSGYFTGGMSGSGPLNQNQLTAGLGDTANWTLGNHTVKFGGSGMFNRYQETGPFNGSTIGNFTSGAGSVTGNAAADFLLGRASSFQQNSGAEHRLHAWDPSLFVQDNWRVARRLTLNLGTRWEVYYPFSGENNFGTFQAGVQSQRFPTAPLGLLSSGDPGVPDGILHASYLKFAPRVGFAMDVFGNGKTSLRGGYGLFYSTSQETFAGNLEQQPFTLAITLNATNSFTNPYAGIAPYNGKSPFPYVVNLQNPNFVFNSSTVFAGLKPNSSTLPYVQAYNLTVEQQHGPDWFTRISYVGNGGRHFYIARDENAPIYSPTATTANIAARRPLQGYGTIGLLDPSSNSSYNSLQVSVNRRLKNRISFGAFYVWSRTEDTVSSDPGNSTSFSLVNEYDPAADRGLSSIHVPQRFVANFLVQSPDVKRWGLVGKEVLSGWQLNGIVTLSTGSPFNITANSDLNLDGTNNDRPDIVGTAKLAGGRSKTGQINQFFNTAAFALPPKGVPAGNTPRNYLIGPGSANTDISAFKRFKLLHEANVLYRFEAFNLFNRTNLSGPGGTLGTSTFGKITGSGSPRILQMALKLEF
jgi:hypothetical protein